MEEIGVRYLDSIVVPFRRPVMAVTRLYYYYYYYGNLSGDFAGCPRLNLVYGLSDRQYGNK